MRLFAIELLLLLALSQRVNYVICMHLRLGKLLKCAIYHENRRLCIIKTTIRGTLIYWLGSSQGWGSLNPLIWARKVWSRNRRKEAVEVEGAEISTLKSVKRHKIYYKSLLCNIFYIFVQHHINISSLWRREERFEKLRGFISWWLRFAWSACQVEKISARWAECFKESLISRQTMCKGLIHPPRARCLPVQSRFNSFR